STILSTEWTFERTRRVPLPWRGCLKAGSDGTGAGSSNMPSPTPASRPHGMWRMEIWTRRREAWRSPGRRRQCSSRSLDPPPVCPELDAFHWVRTSCRAPVGRGEAEHDQGHALMEECHVQRDHHEKRSYAHHRLHGDEQEEEDGAARMG